MGNLKTKGIILIIAGITLFSSPADARRVKTNVINENLILRKIYNGFSNQEIAEVRIPKEFDVFPRIAVDDNVYEHFGKNGLEILFNNIAEAVKNGEGLPYMYGIENRFNPFSFDVSSYPTAVKGLHIDSIGYGGEYQLFRVIVEVENIKGHFSYADRYYFSLAGDSLCEIEQEAEIQLSFKSDGSIIPQRFRKIERLNQYDLRASPYWDNHRIGFAILKMPQDYDLFTRICVDQRVGSQVEVERMLRLIVQDGATERVLSMWDNNQAFVNFFENIKEGTTLWIEKIEEDNREGITLWFKNGPLSRKRAYCITLDLELAIKGTGEINYTQEPLGLDLFTSEVIASPDKDTWDAQLEDIVSDVVSTSILETLRFGMDYSFSSPDKPFDLIRVSENISFIVPWTFAPFGGYMQTEKLYLLKGSIEEEFKDEWLNGLITLEVYPVNGRNRRDMIRSFIAQSPADEICFHTLWSEQPTARDEEWAEKVDSMSYQISKCNPPIIDELGNYFLGLSEDELRNIRILDSGCGDGTLIDTILETFSFLTKDNISGFDRNVDLVTQCRTRGLDVIEGDILNIPFRESDFDIVIASGLLTYNVLNFKEVNLALDEVERVLKSRSQDPKSGLFIITGNMHLLPDIEDPFIYPRIRFERRGYQVERMCFPERIFNSKSDDFYARDFFVLIKQ